MRALLRLTAVVPVLLALLSVAEDGRAQENLEIPEGYTAYQILGPGINAPPLPFRIEGERMTTPEDGVVSVTQSRLEGDRLDMTLEVPGGTARYLARRHGESFAGYMFLYMGEERDVAPVSMVLVGGDESLRPDAATFTSAPGVSRIEVVPGDAELEAGERRRFVARVYDESGDEVADPDVEWYGGGSRVVVTEDGEFRSMSAGTKQIVALVDGAIGIAEVEVAEPKIASIELFTDVPDRLAVGSRVPLDYDALDSVNRWVLEPSIEIVSSDPSVVEVRGSTLIAKGSGRATVTLSADAAREALAIEVVPASGSFSIT
ncbi:MAG: hypothetical protein KY397_06040, partial [Gemmatimonadetes bacterium]|nr:hypothetical protein [Gemmatimonadota bacterium]